MLGWLIIIYPEQFRGSEESEYTIARWETDFRGLRWLDPLAELGLVELTERNGGYPMRYVGRSKDILPLIADAVESKNNPDFVSNYLHEDVKSAFLFSIQNHKPLGPLKVNADLLQKYLQSNERVEIKCWDLS